MTRRFVAGLVLTALCLTFYGCSSSQPSDDHAISSDSDGVEIDEVQAALAKLSPEDAESAKQQKNCPVSGEPLGSMGAPEKVDVKGTSVWICCAGCKDRLLEKPDEFLAKLNPSD